MEFKTTPAAKRWLTVNNYRKWREREYTFTSEEVSHFARLRPYSEETGHAYVQFSQSAAGPFNARSPDNIRPIEGIN